MRTGETRIVGLRLGEVEIDLISDFPGRLVAKFALLRDDGASCGQVAKNSWSEKATQALEAFVAALEEDACGDFFKGVTNPDADAPLDGPTPTEIKQF